MFTFDETKPLAWNPLRPKSADMPAIAAAIVSGGAPRVTVRIAVKLIAIHPPRGRRMVWLVRAVAWLLHWLDWSEPPRAELGGAILLDGKVLAITQGIRLKECQTLAAEIDAPAEAISISAFSVGGP